MTPEEHRQRHIELHRALDEVLADWLRHVDNAGLSRPVEEMLRWSFEQTQQPSEDPRF